MEEYRSLSGTWHDQVFFTESPAEGARISATTIKVEISRQNSDLRQVKSRLASRVKATGGNALVGFAYGQRSHKIWQQLFTLKWDTRIVVWERIRGSPLMDPGSQSDSTGVRRSPRGGVSQDLERS